jgi:uncharacterized membrane protein YphA (DoxX/SURF4 family)
MQVTVVSIYVEILIRGNIDDLWEKTQQPKLHQRWDLRFSEIDYLLRESGHPQRFLYATRIGAGLRIDGAGESTGDRDDATGQRTSALKFWSEDPKSLIATGSGYWKYIPTPDGTRFITWYDYRVRFGTLGRVLDWGFRRIIGWATAWSFDRLRLWIECGIPPEVSRAYTWTYSIARGVVAFVWFYHGLVPKLLFHNVDEFRMMSRIAGMSAITGVALAGWLEVCFGILMLLLWRSRWPLWLTICFMVLALVDVVVSSPKYLSGAFNPVTLNLSVAALAAIALLSREYIPTANSCLRRPPEAIS